MRVHQWFSLCRCVHDDVVEPNEVGASVSPSASRVRLRRAGGGALAKSRHALHPESPAKRTTRATMLCCNDPHQQPGAAWRARFGRERTGPTDPAAKPCSSPPAAPDWRPDETPRTVSPLSNRCRKQPGCAAASAGNGRTALDLLFEDRDFLAGQLRLRRHREMVIHAAHGLDEQALFNIAGFDGRAVVTAARPAAARIQREPAFDFLPVRMSLEAALLEQRQHFGIKECRVICCTGTALANANAAMRKWRFMAK